VRRAKTEAKNSQKTPVASAEVTGSPAELAAVETGRADLSEAGSVQAWSLIEGTGPLTVTVVLAPAEPQ
jgi:valyl-tRNA synthetase